MAGVTLADGPHPRSPEPAAPNQSLTLEPPQPTDTAAVQIDAASAPAVVASDTTPASSWPEVDGASIAANPKRSPRVFGSAPRRSLADALRSDAGAAPWYRGGLGATAIVVGTILLLFLCVRRWLPKAAPQDSTTLRVAARVALTPRHSLALVQVGRRFLVLGLSPDNVSGVCDIQNEEEVAELKAHFGAGRPLSRRFDALVAAEAEAFSQRRDRTERPGADRSLLGQSGSVPGNESWKSLADLRRRIHALSSRGRHTASRVH